MLSPTDLCGNSASDWNTMQVGRLLAGMSLIRWPRRMMSPLVGDSMPASIRSIVVLPDPDGPTMVNISPSRISRSTWSTALCPEKVLVRSRSVRIGPSPAMALFHRFGHCIGHGGLCIAFGEPEMAAPGAGRRRDGRR
jgi:hypothetical protein